MRWHRLVLILVALTIVVGCAPRRSAAPPPGPSQSVFYAINKAFYPYGAAVRDQALRVAKCESGWVPTAGAGEYYQGLFQLGRHIAAINNYGGNFLDPYQNAAAARDLWLTRGQSWSAWPNCRP
jgi:hypothetical protein